MSVIRIMTNFNIELEFPAAPFHRRLLAWVLDIIILFIIARIAIEFLQQLQRNNAGSSLVSLLSVLLIILLLSYHFICEITMNGQSFGKKITGIRVVNENGGQPGIGQFMIRWLIRTSDLMAVFIIILSASGGGDIETYWQIGIPLGLFITDVILVNASKKNQRLGDMLAHTLLIRTSEKHSITDTVFLNIEDSYTPSFPQVMHLSDRDINSLKGIIDASRKRNDYNLAEMASNKIRNHLNIQTTLPPLEFLEVLLKDYNYLSAH
jgi:uncharacterized RDD family membrane protein YckC